MDGLDGNGTFVIIHAEGSSQIFDGYRNFWPNLPRGCKTKIAPCYTRLSSSPFPSLLHVANYCSTKLELHMEMYCGAGIITRRDISGEFRIRTFVICIKSLI